MRCYFNTFSIKPPSTPSRNRPQNRAAGNFSRQTSKDFSNNGSATVINVGEEQLQELPEEIENSEAMKQAMKQKKKDEEEERYKKELEAKQLEERKMIEEKLSEEERVYAEQKRVQEEKMKKRDERLQKIMDLNFDDDDDDSTDDNDDFDVEIIWDSEEDDDFSLGSESDH